MSVSTADVEAILGRDLTAAEETRATRLLEITEDLVEAAIPGLSIAEGTETVNIPLESDGLVLWTPRYPVTDIASLSPLDGDAIDDANYYFSDKGRIVLRRSRTDDFEINLVYFPASSVYTVEYDYGFAAGSGGGLEDGAVTAAIAAPVAAAIRRQATNPNNVLNEQTGPFSVGYGAAEQQAVAAGLVVDVSALKRWRRNRAVSVPMWS